MRLQCWQRISCSGEALTVLCSSSSFTHLSGLRAMPTHEVGVSLSMSVVCSITAVAVLLPMADAFGRSFHVGGNVNVIDVLQLPQ